MATLVFSEGASHPPSFAGAPGQLLPNVIDGMASTRPEAIYALIPSSFTSYDAGFRKVTYRQLANAINGTAHFLSQQLGPPTSSKVFAYVGPNDIGYICYILGAVKAGHKLLLLSPRNTPNDFASLFERTKCETLVTLPPPHSPTVTTILGALEPQPRVAYGLNIFQLLEGDYPHFPYPKTYQSAKDETLVIVHTSGTTGTPKLVYWTHAFAAGYTRWSREPAPAGFENSTALFQAQRVLNTFPFFHGGGIITALFQTVMNQNLMVTCLAAVPPSAQGIADALRHVDVDVISMIAPFIEQLAKKPELLDFVLSKANGVAFGGADVSEFAANAFISRGARIAGFNGSTETTSYPLIRPREGWDPADLKYIQPHPIANIQFRPTGMADLCEGVLVRNEDPERTQPVFHLYPELQEFYTKDLFSPHPQKPGLWLYRGRADDMIVSAAGEMCNPVPFEQGMARLPQVASAIMIGTGRYQKALLVEPTDLFTIDREGFLDRIWATVEACNQDYPPVNRIVRDHIIITEADIPLKRAGKGTVQRAASLNLYKEQIDALYETAGDGIGGNEQPYLVHVSAMELGESK